MSETTPHVPANHIQCEAGDGPLRRGDAVIRTDGHRQLGWHKDCYTVHRAVEHVDVVQVAAEVGPLTARLARAGLR